MEFRTPVHIAPFGFRIGHSHKGLLIGSCFADRIGRIMRSHKLPVTVNPFGTLFNPA
ncbi:MAG: GSCFA domain-containing protein [Alistipes sp.]